MRTLLSTCFASLVAVLPALSAAEAADAKIDDDTMCASVYTHAASAARGYGMSSAGFEASAQMAANAHLAASPREDRQAYLQSITVSANKIDAALTAGTLSSQDFMTMAQDCNARYGAAGRGP